MPSTIPPRSWPEARCRAGVKNVSRYRRPCGAACTTDSYAARSQSSGVTSISWTNQKISRNPFNESYEYRSSIRGTGRRCPFLLASSATVAGAIVPSRWQWSSTFGSRS